MRTMPTNMTVQDFLAALDRKEIVVNREYQRSDGVWPETARSYLIETVLFEFPIPKLALHQVTDVLTGTSHKELVDGQQRCATLKAFREDAFKLASVVEHSELRGLRYSALSHEQRLTFLNYQLNIDLFLGAEPKEIREVFRRMNSYTVPLNPEEQRHALYQGTFKWFLHRLGLSLNEAWVEMGIFGQKPLVRMADTKLLAEICHAMMHGIKTTNKKLLDGLYRDNDTAFPQDAEFDRRITEAVAILREWRELHGTVLAKPFQVYALLLALTHVQDPVPALQAAHTVSAVTPINRDAAVERLSRCVRAIDEEVETGRYARFVKASSEKTNVKEEREVRFAEFCDAIGG